jgi:DNA-binding transcriptional MerR regulator
MFQIGVFARLSQVSVKTLRHYDERGLLKPIHVDEWSGYRYYGLEQLPRLHRILALKDLGLSLEQIAVLLNRAVSPADMRAMLAGKQAELAAHIAEEQARLQRVEARLQQIEQEGTMSTYDVVIKRIEPQLVASVQDAFRIGTTSPPRSTVSSTRFTPMSKTTGAVRPARRLTCGTTLRCAGATCMSRPPLRLRSSSQKATV